MSTLTKILIVLLTISSIFLCGIVVTYVASADNYKEQSDSLRTQWQAAQQSQNDAIAQLNKTVEETDRQKEQMGNQIAALEGQIEQLESELLSVESALDDANHRVNNWNSITNSYSQTNELQAQLLKETLAENAQLQAELAKSETELEQIIVELRNRNAIISQLEAQAKLDLEEKTELQNQLNRYLQPLGKAAAAPATVTTIPDEAQIAPATVAIDLKGLISALDLKNSTAEISLGASDGVVENMRFHVTRGELFICDIVIFEVDSEQAVGTLELVQQTQETPRVGDIVSTNL